MKFDGVVDPFGHHALRAKAMDSYTSVLGSNSKRNGEETDDKMIIPREFTRN